MSKLPLHLDLIPMDLAWGDPEANLGRMEEAIAQRLSASPQIDTASRLFVFPEVSLTGFMTEGIAAAAISRLGPELERARALARKFKTALLVGFPEKVEGQSRPYNTILLISPDGQDLADYQKVHLYTASQPPESEGYERGTAGTLFAYRGWQIGLAICFDLRFPGLFHAYASAGADLVILPACWIGGPGKSHQLRTLSAARAIEGQCFFASLNRSGKDPAASYEGEVLCYGPKGEQLTERNGFDLDPTLLDDARKLRIRPSDLEEYPLVIV